MKGYVLNQMLKKIFLVSIYMQTLIFTISCQAKPDETINSSSIDSVSESIEVQVSETESISNSNLIDIHQTAFGYWDITGVLVDSDIAKHTDFIPVSYGATYRVSVTFSSPQIVLFNENYQPIKFIEHQDIEGISLDKYIIVDDPNIQYMSINYNPTDEVYIYAYEVDNADTSNTKPKVGFIGDSITDGYMRYGETVLFTNFTYPSILSTKLDIIPYDYAVSGALLCGPNTIMNHLGGLPDDLDMIVTLIGINDFTGPQLALGSSSDQGDVSFCGMLNVLFQTLSKKYNNIPIVCLTPLEMYYSVDNQPNSMGDTLEDYATAIQNVGSLYNNVTVVNTYVWSQNEFSPSNTDTHTDALHLTQLGQYKLANYLYGELIKTDLF